MPIITIPTTLRFPQVVNGILPKLNTTRMEAFVSAFSSYRTRYYTSSTGIASQQWLLNEVRTSLNGYPGNSRLDEFIHCWLEQRSIIVKITGSDPILKNEVVILGAHQDSTNGGSTLAAPGADDNASGSVVVLETLRVLVEQRFVPKRTLEFHWYAAEEVGLRGSGEIARTYRDTNVNVVSMVNYDVPGYLSPGRTAIRLVTDYVDPTLSTFLTLVVNGYCDVDWERYSCGYGCSDHASWYNYGYPAARPASPVNSPYMHTANDVITTVGFDQIKEFTKLAVGYVVEMSEPTSTN